MMIIIINSVSGLNRPPCENKVSTTTTNNSNNNKQQRQY